MKKAALIPVGFITGYVIWIVVTYVVWRRYV